MASKKQKLLGIVICLYTGLRIGELLALTWNDVDFEKGEIKILDCPMNDSEKIYSCFRSGENICYETWDGDDIFRCYLTTMDDLMALETKSLDLSHSLLDLDNLEQ